MEIHKDLYVTIDFFKYQDKNFIVWVAPLLKPLQVTAKEYIFTEGEIAKESKFYYEDNYFHSLLFGEWICSIRSPKIWRHYLYPDWEGQSFWNHRHGIWSIGCRLCREPSQKARSEEWDLENLHCIGLNWLWALDSNHSRHSKDEAGIPRSIWPALRQLSQSVEESYETQRWSHPILWGGVQTQRGEVEVASRDVKGTVE